MKLSLKVFSLLAFLFSALPAHAQMMQWGTGMYGAMQGCPQGQQIPAAVKDSLKDYKEEQRYVKEIKDRLNRTKKERDKLERQLDDAKGVIESVFKPEWSAHFMAHMDNRRYCVAYSSHSECAGETSKATTDAKDGKAKDGNEARCNLKVPKKGESDWNNVCDDSSPGVVSGEACNSTAYTYDAISSRDKSQCAPSLAKYGQIKTKMTTLDRDITNLEALLDRAQARSDKAKDRIQSDLESATEGGVCIECLAKGNGGGDGEYEKKTDWGWVISNGLVGALAMYAGSRAENNRAYYNAQLGFPTQQTYPTFMYGMPFFLNGLYGALNGGVAGGAFGCGGSMGGGIGGMGGMGGMGGNGMWGYPGGMMGNPMGGGIFMPGMGGYPYGGMGFPGGMGMMMPGGMMMGGGYPMPGAMMMGGYPGMMMAGGMMMPGGMPGMMAAGGMMMPGMGGMMGYPMGGGMMAAGGMMMPGMGGMMGYPMGGGMGMPMGGGMGMPMGGGMMAAGGIMMPGMGMQMGGMPMSGGMMMGGGMDGGMGMQMQMQMMQMQQQYMQMQMQAQMRAQENYMQRQRIVSGLYQELQGLTMRIQCVQSGTCGGDMLGVGGMGGMGGFSGGIGGGIGIQTPSFTPTGTAAPGAPTNTGNYIR